MKKVVLLLSLCPMLYLGQIKEMITGGEGVHISQVPYQVAIYKNGSFSCGGSILNQEWILTAAHCVEEPFTYAVKVGISRLDEVGTSFNIGQKVIHPNYSLFTKDNDIALIKINGIINYNTDTKPISILNSAENLYNEGRISTASGWGQTEPAISGVSNQLKKVDIPIISNSLASSQLDIIFPNHPPLTQNMVATGAVNDERKGVCHGDSGGALVTKDEYGVTKQIGIVSWGKAECVGGRNSPSIYTKVANYIDWIKQYVSLSSNVEGKNTLCNAETATYTFDASGASFTWQVSDNLVKNSETGSSITITPKPNATGAAYIKAIIDGKEITKKIWIGKPKYSLDLKTQNNYVHMKLNGSSMEEQGVTNIKWEKKYNSGGCYASFTGNGLSGVAHGNCFSWIVGAKITITNACGDTVIEQPITPEAPLPCNNNYSIVQAGGVGEYKIIMPCRNSLDVMTTTDSISGYSIQIVDHLGYIKHQITDTTFSINHLLSGTYYARVIKDGQVVHTQTLIKK